MSNDNLKSYDGVLPGKETIYGIYNKNKRRISESI